MIKAFKQYLQTLKLSPVSRKLYISDVTRFLSSLGADLTTLDQLISPESYSGYLDALRSQAMAPSMIKRTIASLKQFGSFLTVTYGVKNPMSRLSLTPKLPTNDYIKHFTNYLNTAHLSESTIKSYKSDTSRYLDWATENLPGSQLSEVLDTKNVKKYLIHLSESGSSLPSTIERKSKAITRFADWYSKSYPQSTVTDNANSVSGRGKALSSAPKFGSLSEGRVIRTFATNETPDLSPSIVKTNNHRKTHLSLVPNLANASVRNFATLLILLVFTSALAIFGYRQFSRDASLTAAYPSTPVTPNRQLSFQGRLENAAGTPITTATNLTFKLFNALTGPTELYSTGACSITPDADGVFSTQIGSTCGSAIPATVFTENTGIWLEVTVVAETLSPRQPIASVAYALNSETIQGFPISSTVSAIRNTVVPMNQWGEIIVGEQSPRLTGVSGTFQISAPSLSFVTTTGTNGNINFAPDGTGQINATGNTTSTNFFNVSNAQLTTGSLITGTAANNNTGFKLLDLLSGSSPTSKFSVTDAGLTTIGSNLVVQGTTGITFNTGVGGDITFANGEKIDNDTDGTLALTAPTTSFSGDVKISGGDILDSNGNENLRFGTTASAVDELTLTNAATGGTVLMAATGDDTDIALSIDAKGSDALNLNGTGTGDILLGGGAGSTGCTIANATGTLTCTVGLTAGSLKWNALTVPDGNLTLAMDADTTTFNWDTLTTGTGYTEGSTSLSSGTLHALSVNSTAAASNTQKVLSLSTAGANATSTQTTYGLYSTNTHTGTASTNVGGYFSASGGTNNFAAIFANGNVGIGTTNPLARLAIGVNGTSDWAIYANTSTTGGIAAQGSVYGLYGQGGEYGTKGDGTTYGVTGTSDAGIGVDGNSSGTGIGGHFTSTSGYSLITDVGNVGIGTATPSTFKLQVAGSIGPEANDTYDLGSSALRFRDLYLGPQTLHLGTSLTDEGTLDYTTATNVLKLATDSTGLGNIVIAPGGTTVFNVSPTATTTTGIANFAGGTTYYIDAAGNAKFLDIVAADTANPGITVGDSSNGQIKIGDSTISDNNSALTLDSPYTSTTIAEDLTVVGGDLLTSDATSTLFNTVATSLAIGAATTTLDLAGGSTDTGCTIAGATGNLTCSGAIATTATSGTQGWWTRTTGNLSPVNLNDTLSATTSAAVALTLTQTGAFNAFLVEDQAGDTTPFVINQTGNVGIGTTAPSTQLHISGTNTSSSANPGAFLLNTTFTGSGTGPYGGKFEPTFTPPAGTMTHAYGLIGNATADLIDTGNITNMYGGYFRTSSSITTSTGTLSNGYAMHAATPSYLTLKPTTQYGLYAGNQGVSGITTAYGLYVDSQSGATNNYAAIFAGGNVGIGTAVPQSLLDVQGPTGTGATGAGLLTLATKELTIVDNDVLGKINFNAPLESDGSDAILAGAAIWAEAEATFSTTVNSTALVFATGNTSAPIEQMRIDNAGLVGIGNSAPSALLTVGNGTTGGAATFYTGTNIFSIRSEKVDGAWATIVADDATNVVTAATYGLNVNLAGLTSGDFALTGIILQDPGFAPTTATALNISGTNWVTDISLQNGESISNNTDGVINLQTGALGAGSGVQVDLQDTATAFGLCHSGANTATTAVDRLIVACSGAPTDIAEFYPGTADSEPGDMMVLIADSSSPTGYRVVKSTTSYDTTTIGVVSTIPTGPNGDVMGETTIPDNEYPQAIGIAGRVVVKVSLENGPIYTNDWLTTSSTPGVAMKATKATRVIGRALETYDGTTQVSAGTRSQEYYRNKINITVGKEPVDPPPGIGKITAMTGVSYFDPDLAINSTGDVTLNGNAVANYTVTTPVGISDKIGAFATATIAKLTTGLTRTFELEVSTISPLASSAPITINAPVVITPQTSATPALIVDGELSAATISARTAKLADIYVENITAKNIVADTISANHIEGLDAKIASLSATLSEGEITSITDRIKARLDLLTGNTATATDLPAPPESTPSATVAPWNSDTASSSAILSSVDIDFVTINNYLAVIGSATITTLDVTAGLYTNNIQSKDGLLALQPIGGIINLANGAMIVDSTGHVRVNGDLTVKGKILADSASVNSIEIGTPKDATQSALGRLLAIYNEAGEAVATIDASGSANLASVTTQMITIAAASDLNTATTSGLLTATTQSNATAGEAKLISPNTELTIESPYVTANSLVYLTPTGNTDNKVVFVKSKESCTSGIPDCKPSFTVGIDTPASSDISFNWWIIQLK